LAWAVASFDIQFQVCLLKISHCIIVIFREHSVQMVLL
jgi:hypothetical protein